MSQELEYINNIHLTETLRSFNTKNCVRKELYKCENRYFYHDYKTLYHFTTKSEEMKQIHFKSHILQIVPLKDTIVVFCEDHIIIYTITPEVQEQRKYMNHYGKIINM